MHWLAKGLEPFLILHTSELKLMRTASATGLLSDDLDQMQDSAGKATIKINSKIPS
jgi:hypothetical protein